MMMDLQYEKTVIPTQMKDQHQKLAQAAAAAKFNSAGLNITDSNSPTRKMLREIILAAIEKAYDVPETEILTGLWAAKELLESIREHDGIENPIVNEKIERAIVAASKPAAQPHNYVSCGHTKNFSLSAQPQRSDDFTQAHIEGHQRGKKGAASSENFEGHVAWIDENGVKCGYLCAASSEPTTKSVETGSNRYQSASSEPQEAQDIRNTETPYQEPFKPQDSGAAKWTHRVTPKSVIIKHGMVEFEIATDDTVIVEMLVERINAALAAETRRADDSIRENVRLMNELKAEQEKQDQWQQPPHMVAKTLHELRQQLLAAERKIKEYESNKS